MESIHLQLNEDTTNCLRQLAADRNCTLEQFIQALLKQFASRPNVDDPLLGLLADEPRL